MAGVSNRSCYRGGAGDDDYEGPSARTPTIRHARLTRGISRLRRARPAPGSTIPLRWRFAFFKHRQYERWTVPLSGAVDETTLSQRDPRAHLRGAPMPVAPLALSGYAPVILDTCQSPSSSLFPDFWVNSQSLLRHPSQLTHTDTPHWFMVGHRTALAKRPLNKELRQATPGIGHGASGPLRDPSATREMQTLAFSVIHLLRTGAGTHCLATTSYRTIR